MSFPSLQQAPVYNAAASSAPQQTAYIQQGRCGNCGVTLNPYPQPQLNQGGEYQAAQAQLSSSDMQSTRQITQASGQGYVSESYVSERGAQQQGAQGVGQSHQQSTASAATASVAQSGGGQSEEAVAEAHTRKAGFDFPAFFSHKNKHERAEEAARLSQTAEAGKGYGQSETGQVQSGQTDAARVPTDYNETSVGLTQGQSETGQGQIQDRAGGYGQAGQASTGLIQDGADYSQDGYGQIQDYGQAGQASTGQIQDGADYSQDGHGQIQGYGQAGQASTERTKSEADRRASSGMIQDGADYSQDGHGQIQGYGQAGQASTERARSEADRRATSGMIQDEADYSQDGQGQIQTGGSQAGFAHSTQQAGQMQTGHSYQSGSVQSSQIHSGTNYGQTEMRQSQSSAMSGFGAGEVHRFEDPPVLNLSTEELHEALARMDYNIQTLKTSALDAEEQRFQQMTELVEQQREFLESRGRLQGGVGGSSSSAHKSSSVKSKA